MKYRHLAGIALALLLAAILGLSWSDQHSLTPSLLGAFAALLFLELPAIWWRMRGGTPWGTWGVAVGCPLIISCVLGASAIQNGGGNMGGIEALLMLPVILVTATIVSASASALIEPQHPIE